MTSTTRAIECLSGWDSITNAKCSVIDWYYHEIPIQRAQQIYQPVTGWCQVSIADPGFHEMDDLDSLGTKRLTLVRISIEIRQFIVLQNLLLICLLHLSRAGYVSRIMKVGKRPPV